MKHLRSMIAVAAPVVLLGSIACTIEGSIELFPRIDIAREDFSLSAPADGIDALRIDWENGSVTVRIDDTATEITAAGEKTVRAGDEEDSEQGLTELSITLEVDESDPDKLVLRFRLAPDHVSANFVANVEVVLPSGLDLDIDADNGVVVVTGNTGETKIDLRNGEVEVTEQIGDTFVDVKNGSIEIDSLAGSVDVDVDNGDITVTARPVGGDRLIARVDLGDIDLLVPANTAADLDLDTDLGAVSVSLSEFVVTELNTGLFSITATINGGGVEISADVDFGTVSFGSL